MKNCDYYEKHNNCYFGAYDIHVGTQNKIKIIEKYVQSWVHKILRSKYSKYDSVMFIDAMCSTGKYVNNRTNEIVDGTSISVLKVLEKCANSYPNKNFYMLLNDKDKQAIECQRCLTKTNTDNIFVTYSSEDVGEFLIDSAKRIKCLPNTHFLIFYDPYKVDIKWDAIETFLKSATTANFKHYDIILTHFLHNDTNRTINANVSNDETKLRLGNAYGTTYEDLKDSTKNLGVIERRHWLRSAFANKLSSIIKDDKSKIAYYPIFNSKLIPVYDMVCYSPSYIGKELFKNSVYGILKNVLPHESIYGRSLIQNEELHKDKHNFYNIPHYVNLIWEHFKDCHHVPYTLIQRYIQKHPYIVEKKKEIDKELREYYGVIEIKGARKFENKIYDFSKARL